MLHRPAERADFLAGAAALCVRLLWRHAAYGKIFHLSRRFLGGGTPVFWRNEVTELAGQLAGQGGGL